MRRKRIWLWFIMLPLLLIPLITGAQRDASADESLATPNDTPVTLVDQNVQRIEVQDAKVWWWYSLPCYPTQAAETPNAPDAATRVEEIARIAATGGITRTLYAHDVDSPYCGDWSPELFSNVTADDDYLYWMSNDLNGLGRLPVTANEGDIPTLVYGGQNGADEIEERGNYVYLMDDAYGILRIDKENGSETTITTAPQLGGVSRYLQVSAQFVFWNQDGFLKYGNQNGGDGITTGVTGYVAEDSLCPPGGPCANTGYVFLAQGEQIRRYDIATDSFSGVLYDSPVSGAVVEEMMVDEDNIYFFERREASCNPFCTYDYGLYRMPRSGGTAELLYTLTDQLISGQRFDLTIAGPNDDYLFWNDSGAVKRLPRDAAAIPSIDIAVTDVEVTQSIQDLDNSVGLIQNKRTGVRVHVNAAGQDVPGVTAVLYRINLLGYVIDGPIYPSGGANYLTVPDNPDRANFDHAFYFELPKNWIDDSTLRLRAVVNPNLLPPEPSFANNAQNTTNFTMRPSPTLHTHLIVWGYTVDGTYYQPETVQDVWQARSWVRRVYPLASTTGGYESPDPGFRLKIRTINDPNLGGHVERTSPECLEVPAEDREFCAASYANNYAQWLRGTEGIPEDELIYSMIWDDDALPFPRGFATGGVSAGPTGRGTWGWDYDGSYGDWYMGHEVGHNVGRGHPSKGNYCGHSASDPGYPYTGAAIGSGDMWGFDVGDIGLNGDLGPRVYPNSQWRDMMSYCDNQWISDYTYEGIYDFLSSSLAAAEAPVAPAGAGSNYIALFGTIFDDANTAVFQTTGLWDSAGPYTPPTGSVYRMRLLGGGGSELAGYDFDGDANDASPDNYGFAVVVPFPANTAEVELVRNSDNAVLATTALSDNPPAVSDLTVNVGRQATLEWEANDPDGDPLSFDVYYSDDNGTNYTAYALGVMTDTLSLDSTQLPGSDQARFRVMASDGMRTAETESAAFSMPYKIPQVTILTPEDGFEVTYGTAVNVIAEVDDLQEHIPDGNVVWSLNGAPTGDTGPAATFNLLPVGENTLTVEASNSQGLTGQASVTVIVNDELAYPGPLLSVGPDQVSWQVAPDVSAGQQMTITIGNAGAGELTWTASSNAPWLSLSDESGSAPGALTLTADPTAVLPGVPAETTLIISRDNGQTAQIPVSLLVGASPIWTNPDGPTALYLPLTVR